MNPRLIDLEKDYEQVKTWFLGYKRSIYPKELLPKTGFIVDDLAACWVYRTDSPVAVLEPMIGNPNADAVLRGEAVNALFKAVIKYSKEIGTEALVALSNHPTLPSKGASHGFSQIDSGLQFYYRGV